MQAHTPVLFFHKSYVAAHTRKAKDGGTVQVAAYYDQRVKKGAEHAPAHNLPVKHLSAEAQARFDAMHKEQHLTHHYHGHAIRRRIAEHEAKVKTLKERADEYEKQGAKKSATAMRNKIIRHESDLIRHRRALGKVDKHIKSLGGMMGTLVRGSGKVGDSTDETHQKYADKMGTPWRPVKELTVKLQDNPDAGNGLKRYEVSDGSLAFGRNEQEALKWIKMPTKDRNELIENVAKENQPKPAVTNETKARSPDAAATRRNPGKDGPKQGERNAEGLVFRNGRWHREEDAKPETGDFGPIFRQFRHDANGAIAHLSKLKDGEAVAALHHPELGDIDLVWGKEGNPAKKYKGGYGLAKIKVKHPEVLPRLGEIVSSAKLLPTEPDHEAWRFLETEKDRAIVRLDWDGKAKTWLVSAYEPKEAGGGNISDTAAIAGKDDTATQSTSQIISIAKTGGTGEVDIAGKEVPHTWKLIEASELEATKSKADNQFRDRDRAASEEQVQAMAGNLKFKMLADSPIMDYGAPTLAKDGKTVIGGNGRVLAIGKAYAQGKAGQYKADLAFNAEKFGFDKSDVEDMKQPVLIRVLSKDVDMQQAAIASNEGGGARMSALEQAKVDGIRMGDLSDFHPDDTGNLNNPANRDFVKRFMASVPVNQRPAFQSKDGLLSQEGMTRLRNAVLYRAYGDSDVLSRMAETTDAGQKNLLNALTKMAPLVAQAKAEAQAGNLYDLDISADIVAAAHTLAQIKAEGNFKGADDWLRQQNLFGDTLNEESKQLLIYFDHNLRSAKGLTEFLSDYYQAVQVLGSPKQAGMFGDATPTKQQLLRNASDKRQTTAQESGLFGFGKSLGFADRQVTKRPDDGKGFANGNGKGQGEEKGAKLGHTPILFFRGKHDG